MSIQIIPNKHYRFIMAALQIMREGRAGDLPGLANICTYLTFDQEDLTVAMNELYKHNQESFDRRYNPDDAYPIEQIDFTGLIVWSKFVHFTPIQIHKAMDCYLSNVDEVARKEKIVQALANVRDAIGLHMIRLSDNYRSKDTRWTIRD